MGHRIPSRASAWPWLWLSVVVVILDQLTKFWVATHLAIGEQLSLFPWLNLRIAYNTGAAFSFLGNAGGWQIYLLSGLSLLAVVIILLWMRSVARNEYLLAIGFSLVMGGAVGNLIDRLSLGYVIDFIDFHLGAWHFATFNLADSAISVGAVLLVIHFLCDQRS